MYKVRGKHQIRRIAVLTFLPVYPGFNIQHQEDFKFIQSNDVRAISGKGIQAFAEIPLPVAVLQVPSAYIVKTAEAEDTVPGILPFYPSGVSAQNKRQFRFGW
jgi:hypothetical protein